MKKKTAQPLNFKKSFGEAVLAGQREWAHDRTQTVGASEAFACHRRVYFLKREPDTARTPENTDDIEWGNTERGNLIENDFAVPKLRAMFGEDKCFYMGEDQRTLVSGRLSATPDGIVIEQHKNALADIPGGVKDIGDDAEIGTEIKSFDPRTDLSGPKTKHVGQLIVQLGLFNEKTNYRPKWGVILYINPVNLRDIRVFAVKFDPKVFERARQRADAVFAEDAKPEKFVPEGKSTGECAYCEFAYRCRDAEIKAYSTDIVPMEDISENIRERLHKLATDILSERKELSMRTKALKLLEEELKMLMMDIGTRRVGNKEWSVSLSKCRGKKTLDKDRLMEEFDIDLDDFMIEGQDYFRMTIKSKDAAEDED